MSRVRVTSPGLRDATGPLVPGVRFELSGGGPSDGGHVFLRFLDRNTAEVLPVPLALGHGLLLAGYWLRYQLGVLWRRLGRL